MKSIPQEIDNILQEFVEELPLLVVQRLGKLRASLTMTSEGDASNIVQEEIARAAHEIGSRNGVDLINILLVPGEGTTHISTTCQIVQTSEEALLQAVMSMPGAMNSVVNDINEISPGFRIKMSIMMMAKMAGDIGGK